MLIKNITSRDLNQDTNGAKKAAKDGPVVITDRGRPAYVLMTFEAYQRLSGEKPTIADLLYMPGVADIEFDPSKAKDLARAADFD